MRTSFTTHISSIGRKRVACFSCFAALMLAPYHSPARTEEPVDFQRQIQPLFAEHCLECHGPDERARQANLRIDVREIAVTRRGSDRIAIVPGNPDESELIARVSSDDPNFVMPPPEHEKPLTQEQRSTLRRWITEGAPYSRHWSFVAPRRPEVPTVEPPVRNPIDAFVAERIARDNLKASPPASYPVLCRRIYLDLIGLPPTPEQVDTFSREAAEDLPTSVDRLVNRLLDSERFGEKWARHWLDVARYSDTNGYEKDMPREQWAWREWVIRAINNDRPYDRFLIEQIAGDLLPNHTQDQLVATGFLRNSMINEEGAIDYEEFRMASIFDRMDCIGKAVLGMSIQCAQCHSHKYDPISQEEYYGMFAFLNDTSEAMSWVYSLEQLNQIARIEKSIHEIETRLKTSHPDWQSELAAWEEKQKATAPKWEILDTTEQVWEGGLNHPRELRDHSITVMGHKTQDGKMYFDAEPALDGITGLRFEVLTHGDSPFGGPGRSPTGTFTASELEVSSLSPGDKDWKPLPLKNASADFSEEEKSRENDEKKRRVGPVAFLVDGKLETAWRADRGPGLRNTDSVAVIQFAEPLHRPTGTQLRVTIELRHSAGACAQLGRMRFALTKSPDPRAASYDYAATRAMQKPSAERSASERSTVFKAWRRDIPELKNFDDEISALEKQYPEAETSVLSTIPREPEIPRETFLLDRGAWDKPLEKISPHVPSMLHPISVEKPDRLDFARWLADRRSPLTARVQVNRVWQAIFGTGPVETPEDFGTRTAQPEHLDLLDWLAVDFMDRGWSTKQLIHTILTSTTYQQTSRATAELLEHDPQNRLLARGPRFRAEAELVRDIALSVSGLIHHKIGGPSIFPPVPESMRAYNYGGTGYWKVAPVPERYRRGIYVFRKRAMPDPVLTSFDAPNADFSCARRVRSNTPMAALVSLNEPIFVEAARALALKILHEGGTNDTDRVNYAFRLCTARTPQEDERKAVITLLNDCRERLAKGWLSINEVATGDPGKSPEIPPESSPQDAAAWTIAARVLLNLDETVTKN